MVWEINHLWKGHSMLTWPILKKFPWVPFQSHNSSEILPFENHHRFCPRWFWGFLQFLKASKLLSINGIDLKLSAVLVFPENYWENKKFRNFLSGQPQWMPKTIKNKFLLNFEIFYTPELWSPWLWSNTENKPNNYTRNENTNITLSYPGTFGAGILVLGHKKWARIIEQYSSQKFLFIEQTIHPFLYCEIYRKLNISNA